MPVGYNLPLSMFLLVQMFGFMLYVSDYKAKANGGLLFIPKVSGFVISLESLLSCKCFLELG